MTSLDDKLSLLPTIAPPTVQFTTNILGIIEYFQFFLWICTVPFYTLLLIFLIEAQYRKIGDLASPFFKLCITTAFIDIITLLANYFGAMFPKNGMFLETYLYLDKVYAHLYLYFAWSMGICQSMCVSALATNRLSAMIFPNQYVRMWRGRKLLIAVGMQYIPGCLLGFLTLLNETQLYLNSNGGIVPKFLNPKLTTIFFSIGGFFILANCFYLIIAYCYLFHVLKKRNTKNLQQSANLTTQALEFKRKERRLFIMCAIIVAVQLTILLFFSLKVVAIVHLTVDEFYAFYNLLSDLFASINPYLLWIFSDSLRKYVILRLGLCRNMTVQPVFVHSNFSWFEYSVPFRKEIKISDKIWQKISLRPGIEPGSRM